MGAQFKEIKNGSRDHAAPVGEKSIGGELTQRKIALVNQVGKARGFVIIGADLSLIKIFFHHAMGDGPVGRGFKPAEQLLTGGRVAAKKFF